VNDSQIVGDFMGLGHSQIMYINRGGYGGKVMIQDYANNSSQGGLKYFEFWFQDTSLDGWIDSGDRQIAGDFMGLGHDQLLLINRQNGGDGKVRILDYSTSDHESVSRFYESWLEPGSIDPFLAEGSAAVVGDFTGAHRDQLQSWRTTVMGNTRCGDTILLRSWNNDYLYRPDTAQASRARSPGLARRGRSCASPMATSS